MDSEQTPKPATGETRNVVSVSSRARYKAVFGIREEVKPITGAPKGKQSLILKPNTLAILEVETESGVRRFHLVDQGETWAASNEIQRNVRL